MQILVNLAVLFLPKITNWQVFLAPCSEKNRHNSTVERKAITIFPILISSFKLEKYPIRRIQDMTLYCISKASKTALGF